MIEVYRIFPASSGWVKDTFERVMESLNTEPKRLWHLAFDDTILAQNFDLSILSARRLHQTCHVQPCGVLYRDLRRLRILKQTVVASGWSRAGPSMCHICVEEKRNADSRPLLKVISRAGCAAVCEAV